MKVNLGDVFVPRNYQTIAVPDVQTKIKEIPKSWEQLVDNVDVSLQVDSASTLGGTKHEAPGS